MNQDGLAFSGEIYTLEFPRDRPYVYLRCGPDAKIAELFVLSSVHTTHGLDATTAVDLWQREDRHGAVVFSLAARSSLWTAKTYRLRCYPRRIEYEIAVEGDGALTDVQYFGGYSSAFPRWGSGFFQSGHAFDEGFNPEPNVEDVASFSPSGGTVIDLVGAPLPGKRHWFFNPPPFCYAFRHGARWISMGLQTGAGGYSFTEYRYHGGEGFHLSISYDGKTYVEDSSTLPMVAFDFEGDPWSVLRDHAAGVRAACGVSRRYGDRKRKAGAAGAGPYGDGRENTDDSRSQGSLRSIERPSWWARPMFCGWGAQCARAAAGGGYVVTDPDHPDVDAFLGTMRHAAEYATEVEYERFLAALAGHNLQPGTVVVDDKWQRTYGDNAVDEAKWPNLNSFIERRHADGQKVLLWLKAWDPEGVPPEECITNSAGVVLSVDPSNPSYRERLRSSVRRMLSPDSYGADGFKIDFTHRIPTGPGLHIHGEEWGLELLKVYLRTIYEEAKSVKEDALVVTHTPHPYLGDVVDMIRLNDMLDLTRLDAAKAGRTIGATVTHRAQVALIACPDALIDTDNWPVRDRATWREYIRLQPRVGVPSLYFCDRIDLTQEMLEETDYELIREAWSWPPAK